MCFRKFDKIYKGNPGVVILSIDICISHVVLSTTVTELHKTTIIWCTFYLHVIEMMTKNPPFNSVFSIVHTTFEYGISICFWSCVSNSKNLRVSPTIKRLMKLEPYLVILPSLLLFFGFHKWSCNGLKFNRHHLLKRK